MPTALEQLYAYRQQTQPAATVEAPQATPQVQAQAPAPAPAGQARAIAPQSAYQQLQAFREGQGLPEPAAQPAAQQPPQDEPGFWANLADVFTGEQRTPQEAAELSEFMATPGLQSVDGFIGNLKTAAGMMFASSDAARKDIIKENFPDASFEQDEYGNTMVVLPNKKKMFLNKPGLSWQDTLSFLGDLATFYGPSKVAGIAKGAGKKIAIGAGTAAAAEAARQQAVKPLGSKQEVDPASVAMAGALGGGAEAIGAGLKAGGRVIQARRAKQLGVEAEEIAEAATAMRGAEELSERTGVPLFRAQKTGALTDLERQSYIASLPGGSKKAAEQLKKQNKAAYDATMEVFDQIAPESAVAEAATELRGAAQAAIKQQEAARKAAAKPLYEAAFKNTKFHRASDTRKFIESEIVDFGEGTPQRAALKKALNLITARSKKGGKATRGLRIKQLHAAKKSLDDMIVKAGGESGPDTKRILVKVKQRLLNEIDTFNDDYRRAREVFADESRAVEAVEKAVGRVATISDDQLKQVTERLFNVQEYAANPSAIRQAKKVIDGTDPTAWGQIMRAELQKRLGRMSAEVSEAGATTENIPGQIWRTLFKNKAQKDVLYAGLNPEQAKNMRYLEQVLKKASLGRPGGSQTAVRQQLEKELKGGVAKTVSNWLTSPGAQLRGTAEETLFNRNTRAMAEVLFDPRWQPEMSKIRKMSATSPETARKLKKLLDKAAREFAKPAAQTIQSEE